MRERGADRVALVAPGDDHLAGGGGRTVGASVRSASDSSTTPAAPASTSFRTPLLESEATTVTGTSGKRPSAAPRSARTARIGPASTTPSSAAAVSGSRSAAPGVLMHVDGRRGEHGSGRGADRGIPRTTPIRSPGKG